MIPKHAESGTGGIPRRAFNNPRAMASLGSSNLSNNFSLNEAQRAISELAQEGGVDRAIAAIRGGEAGIANEARLNGRQLPALNTRGFVAGKDRAIAVARQIRKDVREIQKALPSLDKDGIGYKTLSSREATLRQELAVISPQVRNGGYLNSPRANAQANPNQNYYVPKEYADRARINTTRSF